MKLAKRAARTKMRGIWSHRFYRIVSHEHAVKFVDTFQIVEGTVVAAVLVQGRN